MLKKKQDENPNPSTIVDLILFYITPLEDIVKHFENLFLVEQLEEEESVASLDAKEKEEAKNDLLVAINPFLEKFFKLTTNFIELPVSSF
jgi:hypothetical protein